MRLGQTDQSENVKRAKRDPIQGTASTVLGTVVLVVMATTDLNR